MILISIITSAYNAEKTLGRTIESVIHQTYLNFEYIIVDHGSTDNTKAVIDAYSKKDSRIKKLSLNNNTGFIGKALNYAMIHAKGEYLSFLDADDVYESCFLEKMLEVIEQKQADVAVCGFARVDNKDHILRIDTITKNIYAQEQLSYKVLWEEFQNHSFGYLYVWWNKLYRKAYLHRIKMSFVENYMVHGDAIFNAKLLYHKPKLCCIKDSLVRWSCVEGSVSHGTYKKGYYKEAVAAAYAFSELTQVFIDDKREIYNKRLLLSLPHLQRLKHFNASVKEKLDELIDWITDPLYSELARRAHSYLLVNQMAKEILLDVEKELGV